jgi:hypothetical protein
LYLISPLYYKKGSVIHTKFWLENLKERGHLEDLGIDGGYTDHKAAGWYGVDWMHLTQGKDQWPALVNTVMNLRIP